MKDRKIQVALSLVLTLGGLLFAFILAFDSGATPPEWEATALVLVAAFNALWLIPYVGVYLKQGALQKAGSSLKIYTLPLVIILLYSSYYYYKPFNSEKWKSELDGSKMTEPTGVIFLPPHLNGDMVTSLLNSRVAIGLSDQELDKLLGTNYYTEKWDSNDAGSDDVRCYYYRSSNVFDDCSRICVKLHEGRSVAAFFSKCG